MDDDSPIRQAGSFEWQKNGSEIIVIIRCSSVKSGALSLPIAPNFTHVKPDVSNYQDDGAWPLLLDEYVEWKREKDGAAV
eukprot:scaffold88241_cov32-Tisochrysis_lutea.AAC.3